VPKSKILVVDDHPMVRMGLCSLLDATDDFEVVGEAASGRDALTAVERLNPDIVLIDITLPDDNGLDVMARIREASPNTRTVVLTMHEEKEYFLRAIQAGASGYIIKDGDPDHVLEALQAAQRGKMYLQPALAATLALDQARDGASPGNNLTSRERAVLRLIGDGLVNKEIAVRLGVSVNTIQTYRARMMKKLSLHSVAELIRYAIRRGIIKA
jgi:two-component system, NarL family, response regulator NreC